eukprot:47537-Eustigmatos_ZCMA.PRE.1
MGWTLILPSALGGLAFFTSDERGMSSSSLLPALLRECVQGTHRARFAVKAVHQHTFEPLPLSQGLPVDGGSSVG